MYKIILFFVLKKKVEKADKGKLMLVPDSGDPIRLKAETEEEASVCV